MRFRGSCLAGAFLACVASSAAGAGEPTAFTRDVTSGHLIVDGRFLPAPFTLTYAVNPPAVFVGGVRVVDDPTLYLRVGFEAEPPRVNVGGNDARVGARVETPVTTPDREPFHMLAGQVTSRLSGWLVDGLAAEEVEAKFGRFLFREADVVGADIQDGRAELYLEGTGQTHLAVHIDAASLDTFRAEITGVLERVARSAGEGAVYVNGRRSGRDSLTPVFRRRLVSEGGATAAKWLRRVWGRSVGPRAGASAARFALGSTDGTAAGPLVLADDAGNVALFADAAPAPVVFDALSPHVDANVAPSARDGRIRLGAAAFAAPSSIVERAAAAGGLRVNDGRVTSPYVEGELKRVGNRLWRAESPMPPAAAWSSAAPRVLLVPVPGAVLGIRWANGEVRWRLGTGSVSAPAIVTPDGKVAFIASDSGALWAVEVRSGRLLWSVYPPARQETMRAGMPRLRPLAATNEVALVMRNDDEILVFDRGSAAVRARHELDAEPRAGSAVDRGCVVAAAGRVIAFDSSGARITSRPIDAAGEPTRLQPVRGGYVMEGASELHVLARDLSTVRSIAADVWAAGGRALVTAERSGRVHVYTDPARDPVSVEVVGRPEAILIVDDTAWVVCEGGLGYGIDLGKSRVRRLMDFEDVAPATLRARGVAAIGLTDDAVLTGWKLK